jgi:hypothetical protein
MSSQRDLAGLATETVARAPFVALLPAGHRLTSRRPLPLAALSDEDVSNSRRLSAYSGIRLASTTISSTPS